ncbi:class I SAM-dependent methyltransferase [Embleya hyalina]|uniref:class I SAM-dependent methyltransferase n=1 Tax=Embleya hyalina TaxID=516124 RepID=UPI00135C64C2|nr:class I SAM-dependent methyltransferase [Embleya hyalina]
MTKSMKPLKADPRSFDAFAGDYDRYAGLCDPLGEWLAGLELAGDRALDAGCGSGRHALALAGSYAEVVAADVSAPLIEVARVRRPHERIRYEVASLLDVHHAEGFDLVLSIGTLHHLPDLTAALTHLGSLVRPGGELVLVDDVSTEPAATRRQHVLFAVRELARDLRRLRVRDAWWLYRFRTGTAWLDHLMSDHYLTRAQYRARYAEVFPDADFIDLADATAMRWRRRTDDRPAHGRGPSGQRSEATDVD